MQRPPSSARIAALAACALSLDGCSASRSQAPAESRELLCTSIEWFDGLLIALHLEDGWLAGEYRFVIEHDGKTTTCDGRVPFEPKGPALGMKCDRQEVYMEDSAIVILDHPAAVDLEVLRDGVRITREHHDVVYDESSPYGPRCGTQHTAAIDLRLPAAR